MVLILAFIAVFLYSLAIWQLWSGARKGLLYLNKLGALSWGGAVLFHAAFIGITLINGDKIDLSIFKSFSLSVLLISFVLFVLCFRQKLSTLGLFVLPFAITSVLLDLLMSKSDGGAIISIADTGLQVHVISSFLAYTFLNLAAILAAAIYMQDYRLKTSSSAGFLSALLPLTALESFLFSLLTTGVLLLTMSIASGWLYHEDLLAQHLVHKTVLSSAAWVFFVSVLAGKVLFGWRGKMVWKVILIGVTALILSYFGSKFVLELVL